MKKQGCLSSVAVSRRTQRDPSLVCGGACCDLSNGNNDRYVTRGHSYPAAAQCGGGSYGRAGEVNNILI